MYKREIEVIRGIIHEETFERPPELARVHRVNGNTVDLAFVGSHQFRRGVPAPQALQEGQTVRVEWRGGEPHIIGGYAVTPHPSAPLGAQPALASNRVTGGDQAHSLVAYSPTAQRDRNRISQVERTAGREEPPRRALVGLNAFNYHLARAATPTMLGHVKIGSGISVDGSGVISVTSTSAGYVPVTGGTFTGAITINQGGEDGNILEFESTDVAHGMTDVMATTKWLTAMKNNATAGGANFRAAGSGAVGFAMNSYVAAEVTTKAATATGSFNFTSRFKSGAGAGAHGANANLVVIRDNTNARWLVDKEGDTHYDAATNANAWDDHDDIELITAVRAITMPEGASFKERYAGLVQRHASLLAATGVLTLNPDGRHFISTKGITGLMLDAIRQMGERITQLEGLLGLDGPQVTVERP